MWRRNCAWYVHDIQIMSKSESKGFPGGSAVKNPPAMQETWFPSLGREIPWRSKWQPTAMFLPGKSMDRGTWWALVHGVAKS